MVENRKKIVVAPYVGEFSVLNEYKPDSVIVWGKRLWHHLPDVNWQEGETYLFDGYTVDNGYYFFQNDKPHCVCSYLSSFLCFQLELVV